MFLLLTRSFSLNIRVAVLKKLVTLIYVKLAEKYLETLSKPLK